MRVDVDAEHTVRMDADGWGEQQHTMDFKSGGDG
jgi:hypothetical protein